VNFYLRYIKNRSTDIDETWNL